MPRQTLSRKENIAYSGDIRHSSESRRTSRQSQISRFAVKKSLCPRSSKGLKYKDKVVEVENSIRPPHSDVPFEFVKNANNVFVVQTKSCGNQQQPQVRKGVSTDDELVKYMSKVPGYLQRGEKLQDNILNFGVLDWERLEKWTHKREKMLVSERNTKPANGSCSLYADCSSVMANSEALDHSREQPSVYYSDSAHIVDSSSVAKPVSGKALNRACLQLSSNHPIVKKEEICMKDIPRKRDTVDSKPAKYLVPSSCGLTGKSSSQLRGDDHEILETPSRKVSNSVAEELNCSENMEGHGLDSPQQYFNSKQESIVFLFPRDLSVSRSSEAYHRVSVDGKSAEHNWGSFSDIFSIDEIHPHESFSNVPNYCALNNAVETETVLDLKLDTLVKAQAVETLAYLSDMPMLPTENEIEAPTTMSSIPKAFSGPGQIVQSSSAEMSGDSSRHQRFSFGIGRMTKSLSFRESTVQPPLSSTYDTAKSGPAKPECSTCDDTQISNKSNMNRTARASPLRRLLDPLLRSKFVNQLSEQSNDLRMKPPIPLHVAENKKDTASTVKALLYLTVKSGLPLFKFVVEINNEILASTVKSLSTVGKDDVSWLYTFYSVHKVKTKSGGWKNQRVKPCGFGYNVVGQMKVSEPHFPSWCEQKSKDRYMVKESVLYNVDASELEAATVESKTTRELAAIIVNIPDTARKRSSFYNEDKLGDWFSHFEDEKLGRVVVILPGGDHSLPHEGLPSSLINRWRSGGSCDCGGWDIGCKLRILTDKWQRHKYLQIQCDLYDQEEPQQWNPFFSLIPLRDGLFSVEFDTEVSSLQAFSMSVALINSQNPVNSADATDVVESKQDFANPEASMGIRREGTEKRTPHPPLSPVGRV